MNRRTFATAVALACFGLVGLGDVEAAPDVTIRVVTPFPVGHILADTAFRFKEQVEFKTKGKIAVNVATGVLTEQTIGAQMTSCNPNQRVGDILVTGGQPIQDWAPQYFFFNGPYVIVDYAQFQRVWFSHLGDELRTLARSERQSGRARHRLPRIPAIHVERSHQRAPPVLSGSSCGCRAFPTGSRSGRPWASSR